MSVHKFLSSNVNTTSLDETVDVTCEHFYDIYKSAAFPQKFPLFDFTQLI